MITFTEKHPADLMYTSLHFLSNPLVHWQVHWYPEAPARLGISKRTEYTAQVQSHLLFERI